MSGAVKKWLWRVGASLSGLAFSSVFAVYFGLLGVDSLGPSWTEWAVVAVVAGLIVQSISFFGRPRSLLVLIAWLFVALAVPFMLFSVLNGATLTFLIIAQLVMLLRHERSPRLP
jgi:hypothetical protein